MKVQVGAGPRICSRLRTLQVPTNLDDVKSQLALNLTRIVPTFLSWG